jgi:Spy/CpxP family protein refolding chaperone
MKHNGKVLAPIAGLVFFMAASSVAGQAGQQQSAASGLQQGVLQEDPVRQLNLTAEQREQIRAIREQNKLERAAINQRVSEANRALEAALEAENPDEAIVEQRTRDVAAAQASAMRMRILTEVRIRRVLTPEQRIILRSLQRQAREMRRERLETGPDARQRRREQRTQGLRNQRQGIGPLFQRRGLQRKPRI